MIFPSLKNSLAVVTLLRIVTHLPSVFVFYLICCYITSAGGTTLLNNLQANLDILMAACGNIMVF
jgi:hypothetical protein